MFAKIQQSYPEENTISQQQPLAAQEKQVETSLQENIKSNTHDQDIIIHYALPSSPEIQQSISDNVSVSTSFELSGENKTFLY